MTDGSMPMPMPMPAAEDAEGDFPLLYGRAAAGIFQAGADGMFLRVNPAFCAACGHAEAELLGMRLPGLVHRDDVGALLDGMRLLSSGKAGSLTLEARLLGKAAAERWVHLTLSAIVGTGGAAACFLGMVAEGAGRRRLEELAESGEVFRTMVESVRDYAIITLDPAGHITSWNPGASTIKGYSAEEIMGRHFSCFYPPDQILQGKHEHELKVAGKTGRFEDENWRLRKDGSRFWANVIVTALRDEGGRIFGYSKITRDMTERKKIEEEMEKLALIARETDNAVICTDELGRVEWVNAGFTRLTGYRLEEVLGRKPGAFLQGPGTDPEAVRHLRERISQGQAAQAELLNYTKAGHEYWVALRIQPLHGADGRLRGFFAINTDITNRVRSEKKQRRTQRLESIGTLAGGVAHDLNNALAPILMLCEFLRTKSTNNAEMVDIIESSARRGASMVRQLLTFAKGSEGRHVPLDPAGLLKELESLVHSTFPKNIQITFRTSPALPAVTADPTQLHQVLLNLLVNARDAMPQGGVLTVETSVTEIDSVFSASISEARPGRYVAFRVQDTGAGMTLEVQDRIFDPFFSTKGADKGTGLGLSTVMGILRGHQGFIQVYSQPGQGSTFTAYLPLQQGPSADTAQAVSAERYDGQGRTILVVDDEPAVRMAASVVLKGMNFHVITATDGEDGLFKVAQNKQALAAIVTDLHMPHMDGQTFIRALRRILQEVPVIVASGRLEESVVRELKAVGVTHRLDKPFTEAQLSSALHALLTPQPPGMDSGEGM